MRKAILTIGAALSAAAALTGLGASAASASAVTPVKAITISPMHEDTTSVSGTATQADPQRGPVWAFDRLKETVTATAITSQPGHYNVKITLPGSTFAGFADPRSSGEGSTDPGGPMGTQGSITGSIQYNNIASDTPPDASAVPATQAPNTSLGTVLGELFHGANQPGAATHYLMNYTPSSDGVNVTGNGNTWNAGTTYTQAG
jgi:hypothetical protein